MYLQVMQCDDSASGVENAPPTECPLFLLQKRPPPATGFFERFTDDVSAGNDVENRSHSRAHSYASIF